MEKAVGRSRLVVRIAGALLAVVMALAVATLRVVYEGEMELSASTSALLAGDPHEAAVRARRSAAWYAPGAPHVDVAYDRLVVLATEAAAKDRPDIALLCWQGIRSAALESRWVTTPHHQDMLRANAEIARLESLVPRPAGTASEPNAEIERSRLAELAEQTRSSRPWTVILVGSFALWALGLGLVLWRATDEAGHIAWRRALGGLVLTAIGVAGWLASLWAA